MLFLALFLALNQCKILLLIYKGGVTTNTTNDYDKNTTVDYILNEIGVQKGEIFNETKKYCLKIIKEAPAISYNDLRTIAGSFYDGFKRATEIGIKFLESHKRLMALLPTLVYIIVSMPRFFENTLHFY